MTALRLAVVGAGALGRHHARILANLAGAKLVAVADVDRDAGQEVAARCGATWVADYREIIGTFDAAVVAVPTRAHFPIAADLISNNIDVLVEKPIAADAMEAARLVDLARSRQVILQVGHVERYNPALIAARPHLSDPRYVRAERFSPFAFRSTDIGVVHDLMIHDLDLLLSMVQAPVAHVEAFGVSIVGENEDCVQARLRFADGCIADLTANRVSPVTRRDMQVWSADGCVHLDFAAREATVYAPSPTLLYGTSPVERSRQPGADLGQLRSEVFGTYLKVHKPAVVPRDQLTEELLAFIECVRTRQPPLVGGEQALAAMSLAERVLAAVAEHAWDRDGDGRVGPLLKSGGLRKRAG